MEHPRVCSSTIVRVFAAIAIAVLVIPSLAAAKSLTFGDPTVNGKIKIAIYGAKGDKDDETTGAFEVTITAAMNATDKATAVYNALHSHLGNSQLVYTHSRTGATVTANSDVGGTAVFTVVSDNTQEGDISSCSAGDHLYYTCSAPASGVAWDGFSPPSITVGTNVHAATVLTFAGQSPLAILTSAKNQLIANGVTNVTVVTLAGGKARLHIIAGASDTFFSFGSTDSGCGENVTLADVPVLPAAGPMALAGLLVLLAASGAAMLFRRPRTI